MSIKSKIESLLFISAKPMSVKALAGFVKKNDEEVKKACEDLVKEYQEAKKGIQIIKNASKFQMVSSADNAKLIQEFLQDETSGELSRPSLETLTIIAYRGPISKLDLDRIRGVNCSLILRNLLLRGLVEVKVDKQKDESYYNVTMDFVRFLGISDVSELPDFEKLSQDDSIDRMLEDENVNKKEEKQEKNTEEKKDIKIKKVDLQEDLEAEEKNEEYDEDNEEYDDD
ncbi:SMC-Scp complex subunit ScpB [Candidatus Parcubacteria bacterium]|nr:MAG: SMC-Scp complex subunit ScpB [Candidatus Parcubacteria bacterium]